MLGVADECFKSAGASEQIQHSCRGACGLVVSAERQAGPSTGGLASCRRENHKLMCTHVHKLASSIDQRGSTVQGPCFSGQHRVNPRMALLSAAPGQTADDAADCMTSELS